MSGDRFFFLRPQEIEQLLLCDCSDNEEEAATNLDEEDVAFLESDIAENLDDEPVEVVIEGAKPVEAALPKKARLDLTPAQASAPGDAIPSTSKAVPIPGKPPLFIPPEKIFRFKETLAYTNPVFTGFQEECGYQHSQVLKPVVHNHQEMPPAYEVFDTVCNFEELCIMIVEQSNLYAMQKGRIFTLTVIEFKAYMGIIIRMSLVKLPSIRLYWSTDPTFHQAQIANVMPRLRFEEITSNLHFCDNEQADVSDRGYKIRQIINHVNKAMPAAYTYSKKLSIDEHMVKFKGHNAMKQYMKDKPVSWGFKLWCLCESETGYLYNVDIYTGKKQFVIRQYNKGMGGVDLMDQKKVYYEYDRRSKWRFYIRLFFDIFELCVHNSYIIYSKLTLANSFATNVSSIDFRAALAKELINDFSSRTRTFPEVTRTGSHFLSKPRSIHKMEKRETWKRCTHCAVGGKYSRTNVFCVQCNVFLCFTTSRDCFGIYHAQQ